MFSSVVIGGRGLLGTALVEELEGLRTPQTSLAWTIRGGPASADSYWLDLAEPHPKLPVTMFNGVVFLVAAIPSLGAAESPLAWRVNADAPALLAIQALRAGMFPIFVSSDAVEKFPHMAYSKQKAHAETVVLCCGGAVVRPARFAMTTVHGLVALLCEIAQKRWEGIHRWEP